MKFKINLVNLFKIIKMEYGLIGGLIILTLKKSKFAKNQISSLFRKLNLGILKIEFFNWIFINIFNLNIDKYVLPFKQGYLKAEQVRQLKLERKNLSNEVYQEKLHDIHKYEVNVLSFDKYEKIANVEFYTDNQTLQGDTFAELSFNSKDKACKQILSFKRTLYLY